MARSLTALQNEASARLLGKAMDHGQAEPSSAFVEGFKYLKHQIGAFLELPIENLDPMSLKARLHQIGEADGTTLVRAGVR